VEILKRNGKKRPLGIPSLVDKIVQEAIRMALEPIFEVEFHPSSFGFRPMRGVRHAVHQCRQYLQQGYDRIIEGDIKACFDKIEHVAILEAVRAKIKDERFIQMIECFLKSGVSIDGRVHSTVEGVPQGSIIGPILANVVLNRLDWYLGHKRRNGLYGDIHFVRYADDFCIFLKDSTVESATLFKEDIAWFLRSTTGLELSPEKTLITDAGNGFNFLGFHISREDGNGVRVEITEDKLQTIKDKLNKIIDGMNTLDTLDTGIGQINDTARGWGEHSRLADNFPVIAEELDDYSTDRIVQRVCHVKRMKRKRCQVVYRREGRKGSYLVDCYRLVCLSDLDVIREVKPPKPYRPK
jgi:RNA-directed DNA polymerase